jgi:hypothetical protein
MGGSSGGDSSGFLTQQPLAGSGPSQIISGAPGQAPINFGFQGMPNSFPSGALSDAYNNTASLYGGLGQQGQGAYTDAMDQSSYLGSQGVNQIGNIYGQGLGTQQQLTGQGLGQSQQITGQTMGELNNVMNNYDQNFVQQLGPQGNLGQQLAGEYNNLGITPQSGAFQQGLGNTLGQLGAQNQLQLGSALVNQGGQSQQNLLSQGLGGQLSTAQQGTQQAGNLSNLNTVTNQGLAQQSALAPFNAASTAAGNQEGIINEAANLPVDYFGSQNNMNFAQGLSNQNQSTQNNAAQMGLLGNLFGSGAGLAAAGK